MNLQGFPLDFLLKLKPELEQAEAAGLASATSGRTPASSAAGFLTVSPRSTDEPGVVEVVIRLKLSADGALVRTQCDDRYCRCPEDALWPRLLG